MFGWFKDKPRKTAIRFRKVYDGIELKPTIVAAPPSITTKTIEDMKTYPKRYAYKVRMDDGLDSTPTIRISELTPVEHLKEHDVDVICEVTYTFIPERIQPKYYGTKIALLLIAWAVIGLVGMLFWFGEQSRQERIDSHCYYYMQNGTPTSITIEGTEYRLNPDGSIVDEDRVFLNPFHEELLRGMTDGDCAIINTK